MSLIIPQGSFVSLVGESGCGKSTIAAILSGARTVTEGEVTLGGIPVSEWKQADRLRLLTLVPHNAAIFKGTWKPTSGWPGPMQPKPSFGRRWSR